MSNTKTKTPPSPQLLLLITPPKFSLFVSPENLEPKSEMGLIQFLESIKSIDWEQESYPAYEDFILLPFFLILFPSVRFLLERFVFEVLFFFNSFIIMLVIYYYCLT